jgi:hypothetical protein
MLQVRASLSSPGATLPVLPPVVDLGDAQSLQRQLVCQLEPDRPDLIHVEDCGDPVLAIPNSLKLQKSQ